MPVLLAVFFATVVSVMTMPPDQFVNVFSKSIRLRRQQTPPSYYEEKQRICNTYKTHSRPLPLACTGCQDDPIYASMCKNWKSAGDCFKPGIAIQVCARTCGTCRMSPGFPALYDECADYPSDQVAALCLMFKDKGLAYCQAASVQFLCAGTCNLCAAGEVAVPQIPCVKSKAFHTLNKDIQRGLACGCWGLLPSVFSACCEDVRKAYQDEAIPLPINCSLIVPEANVTTHISDRQDNPLDRLCSVDSDCVQSGYGCLCNGAKESVYSKFQDMTCAPGISGGAFCVWQAKIPDEYKETVERMPVETAMGCCQDVMCKWGQRCHCGGLNGVYYDCSLVRCGGLCVDKPSEPDVPSGY